ncbi:type II toxin-antitoxin system death-on-curing family toxin [Klugiella xanthotipulae]
MITYLSVAEVTALHDSEESPGVRDPGRLSAAVAQPSATWNGAQLYPALTQKAAILLHGLCKGHAFLNGNKRTAWLATTTFLSLNEVNFMEIPVTTVVGFVDGVAKDLYTLDLISEWILGWIEL